MHAYVGCVHVYTCKIQLLGFQEENATYHYAKHENYSLDIYEVEMLLVMLTWTPILVIPSTLDLSTLVAWWKESQPNLLEQH